MFTTEFLIVANNLEILIRSGQPEKFVETGLSEQWWKGFQKCYHEDTTLEKPNNLQLVVEFFLKLLKH